MNRFDLAIYLLIVSTFLLIGYGIDRIARRERQARPKPKASRRTVGPLQLERRRLEAPSAPAVPVARIGYGRPPAPPVIAMHATRPGPNAKILLSGPRNLRNAVVAMAVLGPPRSRQRLRPRPRRRDTPA